MSSGFVYVIQMEGTRFYKIGRTTDLQRRMATLGTLLPTARKLCFAHRVPNCEFTESLLHKEFAQWRRNGEWFEFEWWHVALVRSHLLEIQAQDLVERVARRMANDDDLDPPNVERYARVFHRLARRVDRRIVILEASQPTILLKYLPRSLGLYELPDRQESVST